MIDTAADELQGYEKYISLESFRLFEKTGKPELDRWLDIIINKKEDTSK